GKRESGDGSRLTFPVSRVPFPGQLDRSFRAVNDPLLLERGLRRREPGDGNAERGAGHVVHPRVVAELDRAGLAAVLAADADLEVAARPPAQAHGGLDQLADAFLVEDLEGVVLQDAVLHVE